MRTGRVTLRVRILHVTPSTSDSPRATSRRVIGVAAAIIVVGAAGLLLSRPPAQTSPSPATTSPAPARYRYTVVNAYPHDRSAFTQGLLFRDGVLFESTGCGGGSWDGSRCLTDRSSLRKVRLENGEVLQRTDVDAQYFAEGLAEWNGSLIQLTWQSNVGFVYDLETFQSRRNFRYPGEGWGLTHDGRRLIMSDGTSTLRFLDPESLEETGRVEVTERGLAVNNLNELEMVGNQLFANVWQTDEVVVIDPDTGHVVARIDFSGLQSRIDRSQHVDVLNGIAYDAAGDRLFVTGKLWPQLFEVRIIRD